jgi:hypothetical protein
MISTPRAIPTSRRSIAFLTALATLLSAPPAFGWGRIGHRTSSRLCETLLTPATKAAIRELLEPGESLADASLWPDEHRRERPETAPWHYVNVPISEPRYDAKFCPAEGCVVGKIPEFVATLKDTSAPTEKRREALRFLVHCVQDMHQPVHVGDRRDRGGNDLQVRFFDEGSNLHRVWDSGLIERVDRDESRTFDRLKAAFTSEFVRAAEAGTVVDWADESLALARDAYVDPVSGLPLKPGAKLGDAYQSRHISVAERRVLQSSARLARLLNDALDPGAGGR